jgi:putative transposase
MVSLTLDLYFSGMSLRKIARAVNDQFGLNLGATSVYRWIQRYVPMVSEYVNSLSPQTSETWQADEVFVKMKGGEPIKGQTNMAYLWNVMDRKTRFLLASKLSPQRNDDGAIKAFLEAKRNAHDSQPEQIITDAHRSYNEGISYAWFNDKRPKHIAKAGLGKPNATNNRIERLNGTVRERIKVQRGWKTMKTPLAEGFRIHYNFVKPHKALEGQTPAQASGIGIEGENRWFELLKKSIATRRGAVN